MDGQREYHRVGKMAEALGVSRAGYYAWRGRKSSAREQENEQLIDEIRIVQQRVKYRYGSPRVTRELGRTGVSAGHNRVARLMRENLLLRRSRRRYRSTTNSAHRLPVAGNLLDRQFAVHRPNLAWVSDITYIATAEGWLYLCVVIDLYSRKVIGWSLGPRMKAHLVVQALTAALMRRGWPRGVIFHSDRGSQYCSYAFRRKLEAQGLKQSMSRKGNCWDNAPSESFFNTLKTELCGSRAFESRAEAQEKIFEYIEVFYNRRRLHSSIGYVPPAEFEEGAVEKAS